MTIMQGKYISTPPPISVAETFLSKIASNSAIVLKKSRANKK